MASPTQQLLERFADEAISTIRSFVAEGKVVIASSSFQTHSVPLLDIVARAGGVPVYFLDTGFHFPETLTYRDQIAERLELEVISVRSHVTKLAQSTAAHGFHFTSDPDYCCYLNKTAPMEEVARDADVWISGVRRDQSANRSEFATFMDGPHGVLRYHPMLDWTDGLIAAYLATHDLPEHPLNAHGYSSIGCAPCTRRLDDGGAARDGRWGGLEKTECGLHLDLVRR